MKLKGKWRITAAELGGKKLAPEEFRNMVLELDENSYQLIEGKVLDSGLVTLIPGSNPLAMNITGMFGRNQGITFHCIYKFEGDDLIMCYNLGGGEVPDQFESPPDTLFYMVRYQRIS